MNGLLWIIGGAVAVLLVVAVGLVWAYLVDTARESHDDRETDSQ